MPFHLNKTPDQASVVLAKACIVTVLKTFLVLRVILCIMSSKTNPLTNVKYTEPYKTIHVSKQSWLPKVHAVFSQRGQHRV